MKQSIFILLIAISTNGIAQFNETNFYVVSRVAFGMGMNSHTYKSNLSGELPYEPRNVQIDFGSGISPEIALGFKITKAVYLEPSISYFHNQDYYITRSGTQENEQGYSFNRFNLQLNGKYFLKIDDQFMLDFSAGLAYSMPRELKVKVLTTTESINYGGAVGLQAGFGASYVLNDWNFNTGIRYRLERFHMKSDQTLPDDFMYLNPNFIKISSNGIDFVVGVQLHF